MATSLSQGAPRFLEQYRVWAPVRSFFDVLQPAISDGLFENNCLPYQEQGTKPVYLKPFPKQFSQVPGIVSFFHKTVLLEKLIVAQAVKKFSSFNVTKTQPLI
jgi:hypothetical protein